MNLKDNPMKQYSQRDPKWSSEKLGFGSTTIGGYGCKLTSFAMLDGRTPSELNTLFKEKGCFSGDLLDDKKCAQALGWTYMLRTTDSPSTTPCIAEVDMSPSPGKQQHFVVWQDGGIIDPWTGQTRSYEMYPVVSFRNFVIPKKEEPMKKEFVEAIETLVGEEYGDNLNEKEQDDAAKKIKKVREEMEESALKLSESIRVAEDRIKRITSLEEEKMELSAKLSQCQTTETPDVPTDPIDAYSLTELAGAFFRKLISVKK